MKRSNEQKLRRQLEVLKAQANTVGTVKKVENTTSVAQSKEELPKSKVRVSQSETLNYADIKKDLLVTTVFSVVTLIAIIVLYKTEASWIGYIKFL
jgi:hypothetical protein